MSSLTTARERALRILADRSDVSAAQFARLMWPESKGHTTRSHRHATAAGGAMGAGIAMTAGAFLARLYRDGLASPHYGTARAPSWNITEHGRRALREARR